jgi:hypothetical protein
MDYRLPYYLADTTKLGPLYLHDVADWTRLLNAALALACVAYMLVLPGSAWRRAGRIGPVTGRALAAAIAFLYADVAYAQIELIVLDPVGPGETPYGVEVDGIRPYLITLALVMTLVALVIRSVRAAKSHPIVEALEGAQ